MKYYSQIEQDRIIDEYLKHKQNGFFIEIGANDVRVTDANQLIKDFQEIGFKNIETIIRPSCHDRHSEWIFVKATK